jgi:hypothetical protein
MRNDSYQTKKHTEANQDGLRLEIFGYSLLHRLGTHNGKNTGFTPQMYPLFFNAQEKQIKNVT